MKTKQRFLSLLLTVCLIAGLLPTPAVAADTGADKTIMSVTTGISDPTRETSDRGIYHTPSDYIYFGINSNNSNKPIKWRVLAATGGNNGSYVNDNDYVIHNDKTMFLLSEYLLDNVATMFNTATVGNTWRGSYAQMWCGNFANDKNNFSATEQAAMLKTTKRDAANDWYNYQWGESELTNDKLFFLSALELANYVGNYDNAPGLATGVEGGIPEDWWLRSPYLRYDGYVGLVGRNGKVNYSGINLTHTVRPAFNLNLDDVLFLSAAVGGKPDGGLQAVPDYSGNEWKLTLHDIDFDRLRFQAEQSGNTITYTNAKTGNNEYISALITDSTGAFTHYGRLKNLTDLNDASGTISVDLSDIPFTSKHTLHIFNEQYNGDKMTDYASMPISYGKLEINAYAVTSNLSNVIGEPKTYHMMTDKNDYTATLTADSGFVLLPDGITVTVGGVETDKYTYTNNILTIPAEIISGDIKITAISVPAKSEVTVSPNGKTFDPMHAGYQNAPNAQQFSIENTGNQQITNLQVSLSDKTNFILSAGSVTNTLDAGAAAAFTVQPNANLAAGKYAATVNITGDGISESIKLTFEVADHSWDSVKWKCNNTHHWHECTVTDCAIPNEQKDGYGEHNFNGGNSCTVCSYNITDAETPNITTQPKSANYIVGDTATALSVAASVTDGTLSYQWYSNSVNDTTTGNPIDGATSASYTPPTTAAGTTYYYCVVTNTSNSATTAEKASDTAEIIVKAAVIPPTHTHYWAAEWTRTDTHHWHECTAAGCNLTDNSRKNGYGAHIYDNNTDETCNTCNYKRAVTPPAEKAYTVTINGSYAADSGAGRYDEGETVAVNAGSRGDYRFNGWTTTSSAVTFADAASSSTAFIMPAEDVLVTANWLYNGGTSSGGGWDFTPADITYTITAKAGTGGSISPSGAVSALDGRDKTFTIIPQKGYVIADVRIDGKSIGAAASYTFKDVQTRHTIEAVFQAESTEPKPPIENNPSGAAKDFAFTDVAKTDWFYQDVRFVWEKDLMTGTSAATFAPNASATRAQLAAVFYRMAGSPKTEGGNSFIDLAHGADTVWYYDAVTWAEQNGIMSGYDNGTFAPDAPVTREQLAAIFCRYARYKGYDTAAAGNLDRFLDGAEISPWARENLSWAVGVGLMNGTEENQLSPQGTATRAQIAAMLHRFFEQFA